MSYSRRDRESDVYVLAMNNQIVCCGCDLAYPTKYIGLDKANEMIEHLRDHQERGDLVPLKAFDRLERERDCKVCSGTRLIWSFGIIPGPPDWVTCLYCH